MIFLPQMIDQIRNTNVNKCLAITEDKQKLVHAKCDPDNPLQRWKWISVDTWNA